MCYELHALKKRLKDLQLKADQQSKKTENRKKEVNNLRKEISRLKTMNSNIAIGVPMNKIDLKQRKMSDETNSLSLSDTRSSSGSLR